MEELTLAVGDIIVGMDIGTSKVSIVIGEVNNFNQIEVIYTDSQKCRGIKKGKIIDEDEIVLAVTKLIKNVFGRATYKYFFAPYSEKNNCAPAKTYVHLFDKYKHISQDRSTK